MSTAEQNHKKSSSQIDAEDVQMMQQTKVNIHFLGKLFLPIEIAHVDNLGEIKVFLTEQTILNLYSNFHFTYEGKTLNEHVEFQTLEIPQNSDLHIQLDPLDDKSAKLHIKKVNNILNNPQIYAAYIRNQQQQTLLAESLENDQEQEETQKQPETEQKKEQEQQQKQVKKEEIQTQKQENTEQETKSKKNKNKKSKKNQQQQSEQVKEEVQQEKTKENVQNEENEENYQDSDSEEEKLPDVINVNEALAPTLNNKLLAIDSNQDYNPIQQTKASKLISYINFSGFNPPPSFRKLRGDLFYITLKNLENTIFHITVCPKGFYINKSNAKHFDAEPVQNAKYYVNLLDMIQVLSPQFRQNFKQILSEKTDSQNLNLNGMNSDYAPYISTNNGVSWLSKNLNEVKAEVNHEWNQIRAEESLFNTYGYDPSGIREWNEELQVCRDLPKTDFMVRLNRDKALIKTHSDFIEASIQGAKAVVEGNLTPINPSDSKNQQVYIYNNIFFSFAMENSDNFRQESGIEMSPTVSTSNCDLRNLKYLHKLDIKGLNVLNTTLIDYRGERIIAQSIIPGILASEQQSCSEYGSIDEGKNIQKNEEFHALMKEICKHFYLDSEIEVKDENGTTHSIGASIEIKGIRGTDRRKYMLDLMRLSPRDLNYKDEKEHATCVLRQELITNYVVQQNYDEFIKEEEVLEEKEKAKKEEEKQKKIEEEKAKKPEEQKDEKQLEQEKKQEELQNELEKQNKALTRQHRFQEWLSQKSEAKFTLKLNPSISTKTQLSNDEKIKQQTEDLQKLADFLKEKAIPQLISDLKNGQDNGKLSDSKSIQETFHAYGVNIRYLGQVCEKVDRKDFPQVKIVLERVILVKVLKHLIRQIMRENESVFITHAIAHALNCIFAPEYLQNLMNKKDIICDLQQLEKVKEIQAQKKQSKKNKKKNQQENQENSINNLITGDQSTADLISINQPEFLKTTPAQFWEQIKNLAKTRYQYDILGDQDYYKFTNFNRLALIRDLAITLGLQIESNEYNFKEQNEKQIQEQKENLLQILKQYVQNPNANQVQEFYKLSLYGILLPFKNTNIIDIKPVVKGIEHVSQDAKVNIEMTQKLHGEGKVHELIESVNSALSILQNLYGPVHKDIATCYQRLANVQYHFSRDIDQAISLCRQAIKILKKCYGEVNFQTALAYQNLGYYYFCKKLYNKCYKYMFKSLFLISLIGGESHPDSQMLFTNLAMFFGENDQQQASLSCLFEFLDRTILIYGKDHIKLYQCYQNIALTHAEQINDVKKAIEYQEKAIEILKTNIKNEDDFRLKESQILLQRYNQILIERKKNNNIKQIDSMGRQFGQNKGNKKQQFLQQIQQLQQQQKQQQKNKEGGENQDNNEQNDENNVQELAAQQAETQEDIERQILLQKFRQAKLQKQHLRNSNLNKFLHVYQPTQQKQNQQ